MPITGNRGEWSEIYAFLRLLADGKLFAADEMLNKIPNMFFPILKIIREESTGLPYEYRPIDNAGMVEVYAEDTLILSVPASKFNAEANALYAAINTGETEKGAFEIPCTEVFINSILVNKLKAPSKEKADISIQIHDVNTGYEKVVGFSIKSELGSAPTLLNASTATNFIYTVGGVDNTQASTINAIRTRKKVKDRIQAIYSAGGTFKFEKMENETFGENLTMIDSRMPSIVAQMLIAYYAKSLTRCSQLAGYLADSASMSHLNFAGSSKFFEHKVKELLCSVALGMKPATSWDGTDEASGGYIIVRTNGDVLAYHIYNRDAFKTYLLNNTKLETPSSTKHGFGTLYTDNGKMKMKLNLQIRFL